MRVMIWFVILSTTFAACTSTYLPIPSPTPTPISTVSKVVKTQNPTPIVTVSVEDVLPEVGEDDLWNEGFAIPELSPNEDDLLTLDLPENYSLDEYNYESGEVASAIKNSQGELIYIKNESDEWEKVYGNFIIEKGKDWTDTHESINEVLNACFAETEKNLGDVNNFVPTQSEGSRSVPPTLWRYNWPGGYGLENYNYSEFHGHFWFEGFFPVGTESDYILCMPLVYVNENHDKQRLMGYFGQVMDNNKSMEIGGRAEEIGLSGANVPIEDFISEYSRKLTGREAIFPISFDIANGQSFPDPYPYNSYTKTLSELFITYRYGEGWMEKPPEERGEGSFYSNYVNLLENINERQSLSREDVGILLPVWGFYKVPPDEDFANNR